MIRLKLRHQFGGTEVSRCRSVLWPKCPAPAETAQSVRVSESEFKYVQPREFPHSSDKAHCRRPGRLWMTAENMRKKWTKRNGKISLGKISNARDRTCLCSMLHVQVYIRGVRTADADIRGPGSADFPADADGPRIRQINTFADADRTIRESTYLLVTYC